MGGLRAQGVRASIPALVNDTVATLAGTRYADGQDANVAVIMGTGGSHRSRTKAPVDDRSPPCPAHVRASGLGLAVDALPAMPALRDLSGWSVVLAGPCG